MRSIVAHPASILSWVADVDEERARSAAGQYGARWSTDVHDILKDDEVDCVVVGVPNKWHVATVVACLEAGKHVFCEKPLARTGEEGEQMVQAALRAGVTLKTGSNLRFFPSVVKAKELLDASAIGSLLFLRGWIGHDGDGMAEQWFGDFDLAGGGTFLDNGCHVLDIARWFLGELVRAEGIVATRLLPAGPIEDNGVGILTTADGKFALLQASWTEWAGYMYMEIYGTDGYIRIDNRIPACITTLRKRDGREQIFDYSSLPPSSYEHEFADYIASLQSGLQPAPSGYDGMRAVQLALGVYRAAATGRRVSVFSRRERLLSERVERARLKARAQSV